MMMRPDSVTNESCLEPMPSVVWRSRFVQRAPFALALQALLRTFRSGSTHCGTFEID
jgi:hypothetical protein